MAYLRTKIIVTLGPSSAIPEIVEQMIKIGVAGFRINFAHGDRETWSKYAELVREHESRAGRPLSLIGDLTGPSIRIGKLDSPLFLKAGEIAYIVLSDSGSADKKEIPLPNPRVFFNVDVGDVIMLDDGKVRLSVIEKSSDKLTVRALTDAVIKSGKALVIRDKEIDLPTLTQRDLDALKLAAELDFDYVGVSYVRKPEDVDTVREVLASLGSPDTGIIAKIETRSAVANLEKIIERADIVLVARGDLGMIFGLEKVPWLQTKIVSESRKRGKPVIVATQLLESMVERPVPTRAEINDVFTAVREGVDALMLTGETSIGKYPLEAVEWLKRAILYAESVIEPEKINVEGDSTTRFARGVVSLAEDTGSILAVYTMTGGLPRAVASCRPRVPVYVGSRCVKTLRKLSLIWGLEPLHVDADSYAEGVEKLVDLLYDKGYIGIGDLVLETFRTSPTEQHLILRKYYGKRQQT